MKSSIERQAIRQDRTISMDEAKALLKNGEYGILATVSEDGYPYSVPISYAYDEERNVIIMHGKKGEGHKYENIAFSDKACFTVVGDTELLPSKLSTKYISVVVFGKVKIATENVEQSLNSLVDKYCKGFEEKGYKNSAANHGNTAVYELSIEKITGKSRRG